MPKIEELHLIKLQLQKEKMIDEIIKISGKDIEYYVSEMWGKLGILGPEYLLNDTLDMIYISALNNVKNATSQPIGKKEIMSVYYAKYTLKILEIERMKRKCFGDIEKFNENTF